jgi:predicted  nucleic acid-binding Zn-ribbon protein
MSDTMSYHHRSRMMDDNQGNSRSNGIRRDSSTATLLTREQQLKEEIARLRREEQELREKDHWVKQNIVAVREQIAAERRPY